MKPTPKTALLPLSADPKIVRKVRRDHEAFSLLDSLPGEQEHDYMPPLRPTPQPGRLTDFGRSGL